MKYFTYAILIIIFEAVVFAIHYYIMGEMLAKTTDYEPMIMTGLSIVWGISASAVPMIAYYLYFLFSSIRTAIINDAASKMDTVREVAEELAQRGFEFSRISIISFLILALLFSAEVVFFYKLLYTPSSIFAAEESIDFMNIISGLVFAVAHHVITGAAMFVLFIATSRSVYKKILDSLVGEEE